MNEQPVDLLILDFHGVCTRSTQELIADPERGDQVLDWSDTIRPEAEALVTAAQRAGVITLVLSNELSASWAEEVPLLRAVDHVVVCSDNGILKPDRRAFQRCLLLTACSAEKTLVIDDERDNVVVATSLGMSAVHLDVADPTSAWATARGLLGPHFQLDG